MLCVDLMIFSVLSRMKLQVGWLCVVVCRCRRVVSLSLSYLCVWLWCVCERGMVWCGVRGDTLKKPCVHPKRPRVQRCNHMRVWCRYTRGRFERTHGREGEEGGGEGEVVVSLAFLIEKTSWLWWWWWLWLLLWLCVVCCCCVVCVVCCCELL